MRMMPVKETETGLIIEIRVLPRSSRSEVVGIQDGALKIKLTSPPLEGKANDECVRILADQLGIRKSQIEIISGHRARKKTVALAGLKKADLEEILSPFFVTPAPVLSSPAPTLSSPAPNLSSPRRRGSIHSLKKPDSRSSRE